MSKQLDRAGTFLGVISESTLGQSANGYPQWVARLTADKKYVNDPEEMKHFGITEPGYVDWLFGQAEGPSIVAFLVLFTDKGPLKNYEQLMTAAGWSGEDFQDLTTFAGKRLLFRVENETYKDKESLKVNWIDAEDAPPERTLKSVAPDKVSELNAKFLAGMKKPAAPPKPVAAAAKAASPKPAAAPAAPATVTASKADAPTAAPSQPAPAAATESVVTPVASAATTKAPKKTKTPPPPAAPVVEAPAGPSLPAETTKDAAWEYLNEPAQIGSNDPSVVADAWIAACSEVGENVDEEKFTGAMWAKVRDTVLKDMGVKA